MPRYTESSTIEYMKRIFKKTDRVCYNIPAGAMDNSNGRPDWLTTDKDGLFVGIELKASNGHAHPNQIRNGVKTIRSGGRYIVAYKDFTLEAMDYHELPKYPYTDEDMRPPKGISYELILEENK